LKEALTPLGHDLAARIKARSDHVVAESLGCEEDDLGANDISIRQRIFAGFGFELTALFLAQIDDEWAFSGHSAPPLGGVNMLAYYVILFMEKST